MRTLLIVAAVSGLGAMTIALGEGKKLNVVNPVTGSAAVEPGHRDRTDYFYVGGPQQMRQPPVDTDDQAAVLRWVAQEYPQWSRASPDMNWAPTLCRAPRPARLLFASRSEDERTHGRKLYYLYARDVPAYQRAIANGPENPEWQVLVKEAWHPLPVQDPPPAPAGPPTAAGADTPHHMEVADIVDIEGRRYVRGVQAELFVMYRQRADTPGTDHGWLYGVVNPVGPLGPEVVASGMIESCIDCHRWAPLDRMLGIKSARLEDGE